MTMRTRVAAMIAPVMLGAMATTAFAQCSPPGVLIKFDADVLAYETNYNVATYNSAPGSQATVVGKITLFCSPFADLNPADPLKEYTFVFNGLISPGTVHTPITNGTRHQTAYGSGLFAIYEGSPRNAPSAAAAPPNPPNGTVPSTFADGTLILAGTLSNFIATITEVDPPGPAPLQFSSSFSANYQFTGPVGGTYYERVHHWGAGLLGGFWCPTGTLNGQCGNPAGYSVHPSGQFNIPSATEGVRSTWGTIKQLYR